MIDVDHLRREVVKPVLTHLKLWSLSAEQLMLGIAATESRMGKWLRQLGGGPALGVWQVEPFTHADCWRTYLRYRPPLAEQVLDFAPRLYITPDPIDRVEADALLDLRYCCAIARVKILRAPERLPAPGDWSAMADYHKRFYNSALGKTKPDDFVNACRACGVIQ